MTEEPKADRERLRLGGMALRNGLLIHGPTSWAAAARTSDGSIEVASGPKPVFARGRLGTTPLVRGPLRLAEAIAVLPVARRKLRSARLPFEDRRVIAVALATAAASGLIRRRRSRGGGESLTREGLLSALGSLPALAALRDRDLAAYHGVEHKAIGAYEQGADDPATVPKEHDRCGSNLIAPLLAFSAAGQIILDRTVEEPGQVQRALAGLGAASAAVEVFALADRKPDSAIGRAVHGPGHEIQRLVSTREPTPEQLEVGRAALAAILAEESKRGAEAENGLQDEGLPADTV
jgi:uncharacterized protein YqhQ